MQGPVYLNKNKNNLGTKSFNFPYNYKNKT